MNDAAIIEESTIENNTDVDAWADARRLRINGKRCSKSWRCVKVPVRLAGSRQHYCGGHDLRLPLRIKPWRRPNLPRPLHRIAPESPMIARMASTRASSKSGEVLSSLHLGAPC